MYLLAAGLFLILTLIANVPLLIGAIRRTIVPHPISWVVFAVGAVVVGSLGNYGLLLIAPLHIAIAAAAVIGWLRSTDGIVHVTPSDWLMGAFALIGLACYALVDDSRTAAVALSASAAVAFAPMVRRVLHAPYMELKITCYTNTVRHSLGMLAVTHHSIETMLYPAVGLLGNMVIISACALPLRTSPARA